MAPTGTVQRTCGGISKRSYLHTTVFLWGCRVVEPTAPAPVHTRTSATATNTKKFFFNILFYKHTNIAFSGHQHRLKLSSYFKRYWLKLNL